jgi:hypothetical protein
MLSTGLVAELQALRTRYRCTPTCLRCVALAIARHGNIWTARSRRATVTARALRLRQPQASDDLASRDAGAAFDERGMQDAVIRLLLDSGMAVPDREQKVRTSLRQGQWVGLI